MTENNAKVCSSEAQQNGSATPSIADQKVDDREFPKHLERLAPWLKSIRLLRGPLFWMSMAVIGVSLFAVALLSFSGWVPGNLGRIAMVVWVIFFWAAMMTAFTGWILRREK